MSTYAERSRPDGCSNHRYCRSCDQYYDGYVDDKECQVCAGVVTPEVQPSDTEMLDWLEAGGRTMHRLDMSNLNWGAFANGAGGWKWETTLRAAIRTAMEAEGAREKGEGGRNRD